MPSIPRTRVLLLALALITSGLTGEVAAEQFCVSSGDLCVTIACPKRADSPATCTTAPSVMGRCYTDTDDGLSYLCNGTDWVAFSSATAIDGTLTATRVPFASDANTLADDADMTFAVDTLTVTKIGATTFTGAVTASTLSLTGTTTLSANTGFFFGGSGTEGLLFGNTAQTPDASFLGTGVLSNSLIFAETADLAFDFAHAQQTNPTLFVHSANQSTTQWLSLAHNGTNGVLDVGTGNITLSDVLSGTSATMTGSITLTGTNDAGINFGTLNNSNNLIMQSGAMNPDGSIMAVGSLSRSWRVVESADRGGDFNNGPCGTSACTNPAFIVHDNATNVTDYQAVSISGLSGKFVVALPETTVTSIVNIPVAAATSASGQLLYTVHAKDATNSQTRSGHVIYNVVAEGTTVTCVLGTPEELDNTPTGTLTATVACDVGTANVAKITVDATSSLTQTTLEAYGSLTHVGAGEPLPQ